MLTFKRMSACTLDQALQAWNEGFEGYFTAMKMSMDAFVRRMALEGLSPELSIVAFVEQEPVGIVMSGIRTLQGRQVAYNGGTGVATRFRGQGVGRQMMEEVLNVYREAEVELATLEAISANERAIALYQKLGFAVQDRLVFLQQQGELATDAFAVAGADAFHVQVDLPVTVSTMPFYKELAPWQCQWRSLQAQAGSAVLVRDAAGEAVGYALYRRIFNEHQQQNAIVLYQCEVDPLHADQATVANRLLREVFAPLGPDVHRQTFNFPESNGLVVRLLQQAGFTETNSQVAMTRPMER